MLKVFEIFIDLLNASGSIDIFAQKTRSTDYFRFHAIDQTIATSQENDRHIPKGGMFA
jgi:hypothetical protein